MELIYFEINILKITAYLKTVGKTRIN